MGNKIAEDQIDGWKAVQEKIWKKARLKGMKVKFIVIIMVIGGLVMKYPQVLTDPLKETKTYSLWAVLGAFALCLLLIFTIKSHLFLCNYDLQKLRNDYKTELYEFIHERYPEIVVCKSNSKIAIEFLHESGFFRINNEKYDGNDYFMGILNHISYELCEVSIMESLWKTTTGVFVAFFLNDENADSVEKNKFSMVFSRMVNSNRLMHPRQKSVLLNDRAYLFLPLKNGMFENKKYREIENVDDDLDVFSAIVELPVMMEQAMSE